MTKLGEGKLKKRILCAVLPWLFASSAAIAERSPTIAATKLVTYCQSVPAYFDREERSSKVLFDLGMCFGFLGAVMETAKVPETKKAELFCVPDSITLRQTARVFLSFVDSHPEFRHETAAVPAMLSLREAYPCTE